MLISGMSRARPPDPPNYDRHPRNPGGVPSRFILDRVTRPGDARLKALRKLLRKDAREERKREGSARFRAEQRETSRKYGLRTIGAILARPTQSGLKRLARFAEDPAQPDEVRAEAARGILVLGYGKSGRVIEEDEA